MELVSRADAADRDNDPAAASAVHNLAALLASDCGLPDLARRWCHQHAGLYLRARPLDEQGGIRTLEPLINLARLRIRDNDGVGAFDLLEALFSAVAERRDRSIDGLEIPAASLVAPQAHAEVRRWLWARLLATGARALANAGRWNEADARLRQYKGIGRRMLDGRQVAIIARATSGDTQGAAAILRDTAPGETWENAVTACLVALCDEDRPARVKEHLDALLDGYHRVAPSPGLGVFTTRLGLSVIDALGDIDHPAGRGIAAGLIDRAVAVPDGYAARDLLAHPAVADRMTTRQTDDLRRTVHACSLDARVLPEHALGDLLSALGKTKAVIARNLPAHSGRIVG